MQAIFNVCEAVLNFVSDRLQLKFSKQFRKVETVKAWKMAVDNIVKQLLPDVMAEEESPLSYDIVQEKEPVRLFQEQHLFGTQWKDPKQWRQGTSRCVVWSHRQ